MQPWILDWGIRYVHAVKDAGHADDDVRLVVREAFDEIVKGVAPPASDAKGGTAYTRTGPVVRQPHSGLEVMLCGRRGRAARAPP